MCAGKSIQIDRVFFVVMSWAALEQAVKLSPSIARGLLHTKQLYGGQGQAWVILGNPASFL